MKIGTLVFYVYCELVGKQSIENLQSFIHQNLISVSDKFDFDYRRFGFISAELLWLIPLNTFWKNDLIYKKLIEGLNLFFTYWELDITLTINESGG